MSFDEPARAGGIVKIAFVAALALECASLRRQSKRAPSWLVVQSGPGPVRAARAAEQAIDAGAGVLVSWGLAGGLSPSVAPGTVVLARRVLSPHGEAWPADAVWHARLEPLAGELGVACGDLVSVPAALESPAAKRAAGAATGAVAVDMESAAVAAVAAGARVPFVALRVVVDGLDDALPANSEQWIDERGGTRFAAALGAAVNVRQWRALLTLAKRHRAASAALERLARGLAAHDLAAAAAARMPAGS
jgi:adenosylhomocysteine nucleosidase